jgi:hypothetical protein
MIVGPAMLGSIFVDTPHRALMPSIRRIAVAPTADVVLVKHPKSFRIDGIGIRKYRHPMANANSLVIPIPKTNMHKPAINGGTVSKASSRKPDESRNQATAVVGMTSRRPLTDGLASARPEFFRFTHATKTGMTTDDTILETKSPIARSAHVKCVLNRVIEGSRPSVPEL